MNTHPRHAARLERGFTLVETSIAMVAMMVVGLGAASLFTWAVTYNKGASSRGVASGLAQQRMERLRTVPFDSTTRNLAHTAGGLGATVAAGVTEAGVTNGGSTFDVTTTIEDLATDGGGAPTLKRITIRVVSADSALALGGVTLQTLRATSAKGAF